MLPLVAIVGRPNVGKSTLFNRIQGTRRVAIVQDEPGVTRDRHYATTRLDDREILLVDTGGFDPQASEGVDALIREQTQLAIDEADLVLAVFDARAGLLNNDREVTDTLRRSGKPVIHVANKVEGPTQEALAAEFYEMGVDRIWNISAEHSLGMDELADAILERLPPLQPQPEDQEDGGAVRVALVGRPNAGKSSLLNTLVGDQRSIVSEVPGTTRDPVDVRLETPQGPVVVVDTAGIRRKRSVSIVMEKYAVIRAMRSIVDADVTCLLMDPLDGVVMQDAKIANLALDAGKGLVLVFSKLDLLSRPGPEKRRLQEQVADSLRFVPFAPLLFLSSVSGKGIKGLMPIVRKVHAQCGKRIPTGQLNRFLERAVDSHPHPAHHGRPVRFYYITQPQARPPTFILSTNTSGIKTGYKRYMANRLREEFGFQGTPVRLFFRKRGKKDRDSR